MSSFCIVITGLPASGKSTVGKKVSESLNLPFLDKDDYLETLYEERGVGDIQWRQKLSRESNKLFRQAATQEKAAVLVSHWRPADLDTQSGTTTDWLAESFNQVIELYCQCPSEVAAQRFINRQRHAGHLDHLKSYDQVLNWMGQYEKHLPLNIGEIITVNTNKKLSSDQLIQNLQKII